MRRILIVFGLISVLVASSPTFAGICQVSSPGEFEVAFAKLAKGECQTRSNEWVREGAYHFEGTEQVGVLYIRGSMEIVLSEVLKLENPGHVIILTADQNEEVSISGRNLNGDVPSVSGESAGLSIRRPQVVLANISFKEFPGTALLAEANDIAFYRVKAVKNGKDGIFLKGKNIKMVKGEMAENGENGLTVTDGFLAEDCQTEEMPQTRHITLWGNHIHNNTQNGMVLNAYQVQIRGKGEEAYAVHDNGAAGILFYGATSVYRCSGLEAIEDPVKDVHSFSLEKVLMYGNGEDITVNGPVFPAPQNVIGVREGSNLSISGEIPFSSEPSDPWSLGLVTPHNVQVDIYAAPSASESRGRYYVGRIESMNSDGTFQYVFSGIELSEGDLKYYAVAFDKMLGVSSSFSGSDVVPPKEEEVEEPDPAVLDSDEDGLTDAQEVEFGLDPQNPDTDGDGLQDGEELQTFHTDPLACDTDGDGLGDALESGVVYPRAGKPECRGLQAVGSNFKEIVLLDPNKNDSDGDGLKDGEEDANSNGWMDPNETDPTDPDSDADGLDDGLEKRLHKDPNNPFPFELSKLLNGGKCSPPVDMNDVDCDGFINGRDEDSDNDGCLDSEEGIQDQNGNVILDVWEVAVKGCAGGSAPAASAPTRIPSAGGGGGGGSNDENEKETVSSASVLGKNNFRGGGACQLLPGGKPSFHTVFFLFFLVILLACLRNRKEAGF